MENNDLAYCTNNGTTWTVQDEYYCLLGVILNKPIAEISVILKRTPSAIVSRLAFSIAKRAGDDKNKILDYLETLPPDLKGMLESKKYFANKYYEKKRKL